jgi:hypothetical protein
MDTHWAPVVDWFTTFKVYPSAWLIQNRALPVVVNRSGM